MNLVKDYFNIDNLNYVIDYLNEHFKNNQVLINNIKNEVETKLKELSKIYTSKKNNIKFKTEIQDYIKKETLLETGEQPWIKFLENSLQITN